MADIDLTTPPYSVEAEQSVLGALLLDTGPAWDQVGDLLTEADFFLGEHRTIFAAVAQLAAAFKPADIVTTHARLKAMGKAGEVGGLQYLHDLAQSVPSPRSARQYAEIVADRALRRAICSAADDARVIAHEPGNASEALDKAAGLFAAIERHQGASEPVSVAGVLVDRLGHWDDLAQGRAEPGIPTGLSSIDKALAGGLKPGKVITVAARTSVGKTSLAMHIGAQVALAGHSVLMLSQEMSAGELVDRVAANLGRVDLGAISSGRFKDDDWSRLCDAAEIAGRLPMFLDDTPALTLAAIRSKARAVQRRHGLAVLIVDYLQLCAAQADRSSRHHQVEAISRGLKALAKELGVTILLLSQLNRASTQRDEPTLVDLKESGSIEEDADTVILLHPKGQQPDGSLLVAAILAKNRQGKRCRVALAFHGATQRWVESTADVAPSAAPRTGHR